jgi:hypothetical protein
MKNIAAGIVSIARELMAEDEFTVPKPIRLKSEGSTMNALANARMIADAGYGFAHGTVHFDEDYGGIQSTDVFFRRGDEITSHTFVGLNIGYSGEGPRGMAEFSKIFGIGLDSNKILSHDYRASLQKKGAFDLVQLLG